jgi:hypothetical protein
MSSNPRPRGAGSASRVGAFGDVFGLPDFGDDRVPLPLVQNALEVGMLVAGLDGEVVGDAPNLLVLLSREFDLLDTGRLSAFTEKSDELRAGNILAYVLDPLIHLAEEGFVADNPPLTGVNDPVVVARPVHTSGILPRPPEPAGLRYEPLRPVLARAATSRLISADYLRSRSHSSTSAIMLSAARTIRAALSSPASAGSRNLARMLRRRSRLSSS